MMATELKKLDKETYFLSYDGAVISPPSTFKFDALPYRDLDDKKFEHLCLRYAEKVHGKANCTLYGEPGQKQHGLDILVNDSDEHYILYQCKRVNQFKSADLTAAIKKFCDGIWVDKTSQFILISSDDLVERSFVEEFQVHRTQLAAKNISLIKCGAKDLDQVLKTEPAIVYEFFGEGWVKAFVEKHTQIDFFDHLMRLPERKFYEEVPDYIPRRYNNPEKMSNYFGMVNDRDDSMAQWMKECHQKNKPVKVLVRSDAGLGKSKELQQMGYLCGIMAGGPYPVLVQARHYTGNMGKLITPYYPEWRSVPKPRLLLMVDGLDEVPHQFLDLFIAEFSLLLQELKLANILATVRSNFAFELVGEGIDQDCCLQPQELQPLDHYDRIRYIKGRLNKKGPLIRKFDDLCRRTRVDDLLENPFYLKNLLDIFLDKKIEFPKDRADAISKIMDLKMGQDRVKYPKMPANDRYMLLGKRLAVYLTLTGSNAIQTIDLAEFTDLQKEDLKYSSLFSIQNTADKGTIQFEHNNFQEYLAGDYLQEQEWKVLQKSLFHEPLYDILKPRMVNTANYLFTLLDKISVSYKNFFQTLRDHNKELLLKFEKYKILLDARMEIFAAIILQGKEEEIPYLRGGALDAKTLLDFVDNAPAALDFLLDELEKIGLLPLHQRSLLELLLRFEPDYVTGKRRKRMHQYLKDLVTGNSKADIQDFAIDVMAQHNFTTDGDIEFLIKNCTQINDAMVRGALLKLIGKARAAHYFQYFLKSASVIFNADSNRTGYEFDFFSTTHQFLDNQNVLKWLDFAAENAQLLSNVLDHVFDYGQTLMTNLIYEKIAGFYNISKDRSIYDGFFKLVYAIQKEHAESKWGKMALFFSITNTEKEAFFQLLEDKDELIFRFQIVVDLVDKNMLDEAYRRFDSGDLPEKQIKTTLSLLHFHREDELYEYLREPLWKNHKDRFVTKVDKPDWQSIQREREKRDFELLANKNEFIREAECLFGFVAGIKDFDREDGWFSLQWNEKEDIRKKVSNTLIFYVIEREHVLKNLADFMLWLNEKDWNWFRYEILRGYLIDQKRFVPEEQKFFFRTYVLTELLPKVNFRKPFVKNTDGRHLSVPHAKPIRDYFMQGYIILPENVLIDLLSFDMSGFKSVNPDVAEKEFLFQKIYDAVNDDQLFKQRILTNLQEWIKGDRIIESHCSACIAYGYIEAIPILLEYLDSPEINSYLKEHIVTTISALNPDPTIFAETLDGIIAIVADWQWMVFEPVLKKWRILENNLPFDRQVLLGLVEESLRVWRIGDNGQLKWKLIKAGLNLGSAVAVEMIFTIIEQRKIWSDYAQVEVEDFVPVTCYTPKEFIDRCFDVFINAMRDKDNGETGAEVLLGQLIKYYAITSYEMMVYALNEYELIISKNRAIYPYIVYLRWNKKAIVREYYQKTSVFADEVKCLELVKNIHL